MKRMKRVLSMLLVAAMLCTTAITTTFAATSTQETRAKALFAMGLFQGYDTSGSNFGLNDQVTREQGLILLIRMLGEDAAAKAWTGSQPYTDVPLSHWSAPYIGYGKEKGYTVGMGNNLFGLGRNTSMQEMTTFALRGLGYSDAAGVKDFDWNSAMLFAKQKGVLESEQVINPFTRGVAVDILTGALAAEVKGQDYDLLSKLMNNGVVTQAQYDAATAILKNAAAASDPADGKYTMTLMGKYIRVNSGKLEIRDTTPAQVFTVINKTGYCHIQTADGKYLSLAAPGSLKNGNQLVTSATPYAWVMQKQSGGAYTIRPYESTGMVVNASEEKSANGTAVIIWTHSGAPKNTLITLKAPTSTKAVTGISLDQTSATVAVGKTVSLTGTISPADATNQAVTWSSSAPAVATVDTKGVVKGIKAGTATITVKTTDGGKTATCKITVTEPLKTIKADFVMTNSTGKSITEFYITDSSLASYDKEFLKANNYTSWSNAKTITATFEFDAKTSFDIYIRFSDGTEGEARGLSFAKATASGGKLSLTASQVKLISGTTTLATATFTLKSDTTAASKAVITRFNTDVTRWNTLKDKCVKAGLDKDTAFVAAFNGVTDAINAIRTEMGSQTTFTTAKITEYNKGLTDLEALMTTLETALGAVEDTTAATKAMIARFNKDVENWNSLMSKLKTAGLDKDAGFVKDINAVTTAINTLGASMERQSTFTSAQIAQYSKDLDALEQLITALETALKNASTNTPDTTVESKALRVRLETDINSWNALVSKMENTGLDTDPNFAGEINQISKAINEMQKEMGITTQFTPAKIAEYNAGLDSLEELIEILSQSVG